jgi:hypothetical protein
MGLLIVALRGRLRVFGDVLDALAEFGEGLPEAAGELGQSPASEEEQDDEEYDQYLGESEVHAVPPGEGV